ncbi:MAG: hypothetical protein JW716_01640 [Candidatus Aenigmarchaeota archaeon]|nr:hypothetical protein [Candidatus Aenigmarchaeota archaeon]
MRTNWDLLGFCLFFLLLFLILINPKEKLVEPFYLPVIYVIVLITVIYCFFRSHILYEKFIGHTKENEQKIANEITILATLFTIIGLMIAFFAVYYQLDMQQNIEHENKINAHLASLDSLLIELNYTKDRMNQRIGNESFSDFGIKITSFPYENLRESTLNKDIRYVELKRDIIHEYWKIVQINRILEQAIDYTTPSNISSEIESTLINSYLPDRILSIENLISNITFYRTCIENIRMDKSVLDIC